MILNMKVVISVCVSVFLVVEAVRAVTVNGDCTSSACDTNLTCQSNVCKQKVDTACSADSECLANAQCASNKCACKDTFNITQNGERCEKTVDAACSADSECLANAQCVSNKCACKDTFNITQNGQRCAKPLLEPCSLASECVEHAECNYQRGLSGKRCKCPTQFTMSEDKLECKAQASSGGSSSIPCSTPKDCAADYTCQYNSCKKKVDKSCVADAECVANAQCVSNNCTCKDTFNSTQNGESCVKALMEACTRTSQCVNNAWCMRFTNSKGQLGQWCRCKRGFAATPDSLACKVGQAAAGLNSRCSVRSNCSEGLTCQDSLCKRKVSTACNGPLECVANAKCVSNNCTCESAYNITMNGERCAKPVFESCSTSTECVAYAECVRKNPKYITSKLWCKCKQGYLPLKSRMACAKAPGVGLNEGCVKKRCQSGLVCRKTVCKKPIGASCRASGECMVNALCFGGQCKCTYPNKIISNNTECARPVGASCLFDSQCGKNAECTTIVTSGGNIKKPKKKPFSSSRRTRSSSHQSSRRSSSHRSSSHRSSSRRQKRDTSGSSSSSFISISGLSFDSDGYEDMLGVVGPTRVKRSSSRECRCNGGYHWVTRIQSCRSTGSGLAASFLLVTAIFVTSYLL